MDTSQTNQPTPTAGSQTSAAQAPSHRPARQVEVQQLLGRCVLNLQAYEHSLKQLLAHHVLVGQVEDPDGLTRFLAERQDRVSDNTLGMLIRAFFQHVVVPMEHDEPILNPDSAPKDKASFGFAFRMGMQEKDQSTLRTSMEELVRMRNDLIHQFIIRFDLWSDEGCELALDHLNRCDESIRGHMSILQGWLEHFAQSRQGMAQLFETETFHDLMVNGIAPDGAVDWSASGIVCALRESGQHFQSTGSWMKLDRALEWLTLHHPDQTPDRYGCRSWPHVLHQSRLFDLEYRIEEDGKKHAWFKERKGLVPS